MTDMWRYRDDARFTEDFVGYSVEARDGKIGKIDEASDEVGASYIVVDTGPWIFGKKVLLPAGVIDRVDHTDKTVYVSRSKDRIKAAPEFDPDSYRQDTYRERVGSYYGEGGRGWENPL